MKRAKGRPRVNAASRTEQLRMAKRAQRARLRKAGIRTVQVEVSNATAEKLRVARLEPGFADAFDEWLDGLVVRLSDYPQLRDLAWNRRGDFIGAREAFALYERNWRLVDEDRLEPNERALLDRLKVAFGEGVING